MIPPVVLTKLHSLSLPRLIVPALVESALNLLDLCSPSLQTLALVVYTFVESSTPSLLALVPSLKTLFLIIRRDVHLLSPIDHPPSPALISHLSSTSLQHLKTNYPVTEELFNALPATLCSLHS